MTNVQTYFIGGISYPKHIYTVYGPYNRITNKTSAKARLGFLRFSQVHFEPILRQQNVLISEKISNSWGGFKSYFEH